jgi:hypothetical protein
MHHRRTAVLASALLVLSATAALSSGTPEEQAACKPDVIRYCKQAGADEMVVLFCLKEHREKLTKSCRKVLEDNGQ